MKTTTAFLLLFSISAFSFAENSKRIKYHAFSVFYGKIRGELVSVSGPTYNGHDLDRGGRSFKIPLSEYQRAQKLAEYVYRTTATRGYGSGIHIGAGLVLTNLHVVSKTKNPRTKCNSFKIHIDKKQGQKEKFSCREVLYCYKKLDFCLVKMNKGNRGTDLSSRPAPEFNLNPLLDLENLVTSVGNAGNFGMHASVGKGLETFGGGGFKFYATVWNGSSGGGIFNEANELIGLIYGGSETLLGPKAFNAAVKLASIKRVLDQNLIKGRELYEKVKW